MKLTHIQVLIKKKNAV